MWDVWGRSLPSLANREACLAADIRARLVIRHCKYSRSYLASSPCLKEDSQVPILQRHLFLGKRMDWPAEQDRIMLKCPLQSQNPSARSTMARWSSALALGTLVRGL